MNFQPKAAVVDEILPSSTTRLPSTDRYPSSSLPQAVNRRRRRPASLNFASQIRSLQRRNSRHVGGHVYNALENPRLLSVPVFPMTYICQRRSVCLIPTGIPLFPTFVLAKTRRMIPLHRNTVSCRQSDKPPAVSTSVFIGRSLLPDDFGPMGK